MKFHSSKASIRRLLLLSDDLNLPAVRRFKFVSKEVEHVQEPQIVIEKDLLLAIVWTNRAI